MIEAAARIVQRMVVHPLNHLERAVVTSKPIRQFDGDRLGSTPIRCSMLEDSICQDRECRVRADRNAPAGSIVGRGFRSNYRIRRQRGRILRNGNAVVARMKNRFIDRQVDRLACDIRANGSRGSARSRCIQSTGVGFLWASQKILVRLTGRFVQNEMGLRQCRTKRTERCKRPRRYRPPSLPRNPMFCCHDHCPFLCGSSEWPVGACIPQTPHLRSFSR